VAVQVVIVAGGQGTRIRALIGNLPKVLAPVGTRPFLARVLDNLFARPEMTVHLCLGCGADPVLATIADHRCADSITYTVESSPLGVAGALRLAEPRLQSEFVLIYGDVWPGRNVDRLLDRHARTSMPATMAVARPATGPGNVDVRDGAVIRYVKHAGERSAGDLPLEDAGLTVLPRKALRVLPPVGRPAGEEQLFGPLAAGRSLAAALLPSSSIHIGDPVAYRHALLALGGDDRPVV
jgi:NDP-sugar pyrophosphorylase family protein